MQANGMVWLRHSVIERLSHWSPSLSSGPSRFCCKHYGLRGFAFQPREDLFGVDLQFGEKMRVRRKTGHWVLSIQYSQLQQQGRATAGDGLPFDGQQDCRFVLNGAAKAEPCG